MPVPDGLAIDWLATGALVVVLGGLIRFAGWTWLVAGYSESAAGPSDEVVQDEAGSTILRDGIAIVAVGGLESVGSPPSSLGLVVGVAIVADIARLIYRLNTQHSNETA